MGLPSALSNILGSITYIIYNKVMVGYGDMAVAASAISSKAGMFADTIQQGIAMGIQPLIGYSYTEGNHRRLKHIMCFTIAVSTVFGVLFMAALIIFAPQFVRAFLNNDEVLDTGVDFVRLIVIGAPFTGMLMTIQNTFQGMGKAREGMILALSRQIVFFVPAIFIGSMLAGKNGVIMAQPIATMGSMVIAIMIYMISIKKELNSVVLS